MISSASQAPRREAPFDCGWFAPWRFAALLGLLLLASFPMVISGFEAFAYLDYGQFAYPVAHYNREALGSGELPFWNPLSSCGIPLLAQWNTQSLYPLSLFYVLLPMPWALGMFCLLHLFLGGMGAYLLAVRWTDNRLAAAVAGAVFGFNGFTWYAIVWPHITAALAWMPWVILANEAAWTRGGRILVWSVLASALQLLSGGAEVILLTWLVLAALFGLRIVSGETPRLLLLLRGVVTGTLALAVASPQLLPFLVLLTHSQRSSAYGSAEMGVMPAGGWANYVVPLFHTLRNPQGLHVPPSHWTGSYYMGIGVVMMAAVAVTKVRTRLAWLLAGMTLFSVLMAMGGAGPVYKWATAILPGLGFVRFPVKFVMLATFAFPLLAALGLRWWLAAGESEQDRSGGLKLLLRITVAMLITMGLVCWWARIYPLVPGDFTTSLKSALSRAGLLAMAIGLLVLLRRWRSMQPRHSVLVQIGLVLLLWLDVMTHNANLSPAVPPAILQPNAIRQFFGWNEALAPGGSRLMQSPVSYQRMLAVGYTDLQMDTQGRRLSQFFDFNLLDGVPKVDGFYSLYPKECSVLFDRLYHGTNEAGPLRDFLSVSLVSHPTNIVDWVSRTGFLPLVTAGQRVVCTNDEAALEAVLSGAFEPRATVYLPAEAQDRLQAGAAVPARAALVEFKSSRLRIEVETPAPAVAVIGQSYYPCWRAYVGGKRVPLWRANYGFQAVEVPAGKSQVLLIYRDMSFFWGLAVAGAATAILVFLFFRSTAEAQSRRAARSKGALFRLTSAGSFSVSLGLLSGIMTIDVADTKSAR